MYSWRNPTHLGPGSLPDAACARLHTLREQEKCVCFESGIISSIKSGLVPRECSVCVLACSIRDPPTWDKPPSRQPSPFYLLLDPFQLSSPCYNRPPFSLYAPSRWHSFFRSPRLFLALTDTPHSIPLMSPCVHPRNGTEQVDNLRIIQKLVQPPYVDAASPPLYSSTNHFKSAGYTARSPSLSSY